MQPRPRPRIPASAIVAPVRSPVPPRRGAPPRLPARLPPPPPRAAVALFLLFALAAPALAACSGAASATSEAPLCSKSGSCAAGLCVAGRCRPADKTPVPPDSLRVLLSPRDVAVLRPSGQSGGGPALPEAIALGREGGGDLVLLLRFAATWADDASVASAFVVLNPAPGAPPPRRAASVEIARILDPWDPSTASWGRQPRLSLPEKAGLLRSQPPAPARIEVTHLVREWQKRRPDDHGIALLIDGGDVIGTAYSMGITDGTGPLLEVYVR